MNRGKRWLLLVAGGVLTIALLSLYRMTSGRDASPRMREDMHASPLGLSGDQRAPHPTVTSGPIAETASTSLSSATPTMASRPFPDSVEELEQLFAVIPSSDLFNFTHSEACVRASDVRWASTCKLWEAIRTCPLAAKWAVDRLAEGGLDPKQREFLERAFSGSKGNAATREATDRIRSLNFGSRSRESRRSLIQVAGFLASTGGPDEHAAVEELIGWYAQDPDLETREELLRKLAARQTQDSTARAFLLAEFRNLRPSDSRDSAKRLELALMLAIEIDHRDATSQEALDELIRTCLTSQAATGSPFDRSAVLDILSHRIANDTAFQPGGIYYDLVAPEAARLTENPETSMPLRASAIKLLVATQHPDAPRIFAHLIQTDPDPQIQATAFDQLTKLPGSDVIAEALGSLDGALPASIQPDAYIAALGQRGDARSIPILVRLSSDPKLRDVAGQALAAIRARVENTEKPPAK